jgi:hypothetical protein
MRALMLRTVQHNGHIYQHQTLVWAHADYRWIWRATFRSACICSRRHLQAGQHDAVQQREAANVTRAQGGATAPASTCKSRSASQTKHACWQLQDGRDGRDAPQPHALGAETLRRSASSKRPPACRTDTTPRPTTRPQYFSDSCHLTHTHHARQRPAPARSRRWRRARPVCSDDPRAADGGCRPRRTAEAVRLLRHDRRDKHRRVRSHWAMTICGERADGWNSA